MPKLVSNLRVVSHNAIMRLSDNGKRVVQVSGEGLETYFRAVESFGGGANGSIYKTWINDSNEETFDPDLIDPEHDIPYAITKVIDLSQLASEDVERALLEA